LAVDIEKNDCLEIIKNYFYSSNSSATLSLESTKNYEYAR